MSCSLHQGNSLKNKFAIWVCGRFDCRPSPFWLSEVVWQLLSSFRFVVVSACRRFGLSSFLLVVVPVCRRFGVSSFRFVVVFACRRSGFSSFWLSGVVRKLLSPFYFVVVSASRRFDCRCFGLSSFWLYSLHATPQRPNCMCCSCSEIVSSIARHDWTYKSM